MQPRNSLPLKRHSDSHEEKSSYSSDSENELTSENNDPSRLIRIKKKRNKKTVQNDPHLREISLNCVPVNAEETPKDPSPKIASQLPHLNKAGIKIEKELSLSDIPSDVMKYHILAQLSTPSLIAFARCSSFTNSFTLTTLHQRALKKLFEHILEGKIDKVKEMLAAKPNLGLLKYNPITTEERIITNKAGQSILINGKTAYELALGEEDTEIAAILRKHIIQLGNDEVANTLYRQQFPDGWEAEEARRSTPIITQLNLLDTAVREAQQGDIISSGAPYYKSTVLEESTVSREFRQFKIELDAMLQAPVTTGRHFNPTPLLAAFRMNKEIVNQFHSNFWWQRVIGYVQRFMPANYAQAFCNGISDTNEKLQADTPQGRSLVFVQYRTNFLGARWTKNSPCFYPIQADSGLGFNFAIGNSGCAAPLPLVPQVYNEPDFFQEYIHIKTANLRNLLSNNTADVRPQNLTL